MAKTNVRGTQIADGAAGVDLTVDVFGTLPVGNGGTGVVNPTANRFLVGNGTSVVDLSKVVPAGTVVGTSDAQTLTAKTLTTPKIDTIQDTNGNTIVNLLAGAAPINNWIEIRNAQFTSPAIAAVGGGADLNLNLVSKGIGRVQSNGVTVADLSTAQTLTTKTLTTPLLTQSATPSAPASGFDTLYTKTDDSLNLMGSDGVERPIYAVHPVRASTSVGITLSGIQTIDGISVVAGDRVLVRHQTTTYGYHEYDNGIYIVSASAWTRASDANSAADLVGMRVYVAEGFFYASTLYQSAFPSTGTLGSTAVSFYGVGSFVEASSSFGKPPASGAGHMFYDVYNRRFQIYTGSTWDDPAWAVSFYGSSTPARGSGTIQAGELWYDSGDSGAQTTTDSGWIRPTLQNSWVDFDARTVAYRKINGIVYFQGIAKSGTLNTTAFTLPIGYRPRNNNTGDLNLPVVSNSAFGIVAITGSTGAVVVSATASNLWVDFGSISFPADN